MLARRFAKFAESAPPVGEDIVYVGNDVATTSASSGNKSATITVPAEATFALIGYAYYTGTTGGTSINSVSLDGQSAIEVESMPNNSAYHSVSVWRVTGFSEGNVSLQWNQSTPITEHPAIMVLFYKNVNSSPIRDSGQNGNGSAASVNNIALTAQLGDLLVGFGSSDYTGDMSRNGQTEHIDDHLSARGVVAGSAADKAANSDNDIEIFGDYTGLVAVALIKA